MDEIEELLQLFEKNGGSYWEKEKTSTTCGIIDYKILGKEKEFEKIKRSLDIEIHLLQKLNKESLLIGIKTY